MSEIEYNENAIHWLEFEIKQSEEWLKDEYNHCFNGVDVGHKNAQILKKRHITFCKQVIDILKGGTGCPSAK